MNEYSIRLSTRLESMPKNDDAGPQGKRTAWRMSELVKTNLGVLSHGLAAILGLP